MIFLIENSSELSGVWGEELFESDDKRNQMSEANEFFSPQ
jgi:hypothetical protein